MLSKTSALLPFGAGGLASVVGSRPVPWGMHPWTLPTRCLLPSYGNQGRLQMLPRAP